MRDPGWTRLRARTDRGLGVVEYALALALLVAGSIGAIQLLEDNTGDEVDNQADCLSTRPPPDSCQRAPLAPPDDDDDDDDDDGGGGGGDADTPTATLNPGDPPTPEVEPAGSLFRVLWTNTFTDEDDEPIADQIVTAQVTVTSSTFAGRVGNVFYRSCTTDADGRCSFDFDSEWADVEELSIQVVTVGVDTTYELSPTPPPVSVSRPAATPDP